MSWKSAGLKFSSLLLMLPISLSALSEPAEAGQNYANANRLYQNRQKQIMIASTQPGLPLPHQSVATTMVGTRMTQENPYLSKRGFRNNLPPTSFDSFVRNAGAHAEHIYGDENIVYDCFTEAHRINTGIVGNRDDGLTTGHGSVLPDAWGRDEFSGDAESSQSGRRGFELNMQAIRSSFDHRNSWNVEEYDRVNKQFYNGARVLDKANFYDEDRARGINDPYNPYLATQEADRKVARRNE